MGVRERLPASAVDYQTRTRLLDVPGRRQLGEFAEHLTHLSVFQDWHDGKL